MVLSQALQVRWAEKAVKSESLPKTKVDNVPKKTVDELRYYLFVQL